MNEPVGQDTDFGDDLKQRIAAIAEDRKHGATDLAREALDILRWTAEQGRMEHLLQVAATLTSARPAMAAIKNAVRRVSDDPSALMSPDAAIDACRHVREWVDYAAHLVADHAAAIIPQGAMVVTCSYSSAVIKAFQLSGPERVARAVVLESRVGKTAYGRRVAGRLRRFGIECLVIADKQLYEALDDATLVLVGADRVLPSGALVNGTPSLELAQASSGRVPFYAICESFKLDDSRTTEPGFDIVPAGLVTRYVTERGVVSPAEVWTVYKRS